jgi:phenylpyruvate tautomerase PptA (4-oxalocrotonate tautomerase family)
MPTYIVKTSNIKLDKKKKNKIAMGITETHKKITGADSFFAQVLFEVNNKKSHFMGGKIIKDKQIFLSGQIRAGRSVNIKKKLILNLRKSLEINSKIKKDNIWVYLLEIMPNQMIEYGEILPKSGQETKWLNSLSKSLQTKLKKINK